MRETLERLLAGESLEEGEAAAVMAAIMAGDATAAQVAGFLVALRMKGETVDEVAGLARTMRELATPIAIEGDLLDTCGTGGDGAHTFNISTLAAIVASACGAKVAKHGNRASSSSCGSADVLEALGVRIDLEPDAVRRCVEEAGIGFLFAPTFHPAFRHAGPARRELGVRTVFNLLGPLTNPAGAAYQTVGVADAGSAVLMVGALERLGCRRAIVFHGCGGLDELAPTGPARMYRLESGTVREETLDPLALGLELAPVEALRGGGPELNAAIARSVLEGEGGPRRDAVTLSAAAALLAAGLAGDLREGLSLAGVAIDSGAARGRLDQWVAACPPA